MSARAIVGRPAIGMAVGTAASRATGLARTMALAAALGVGTVADAYNTANTAPNMLFALVAGGTLGAALVPMLARDDDPEARRETASVVLGTVTVLAIAVAAAMAIGAPLLMRVLSAGADGRAERDDLIRLGTSWMRLFAPQVALYAVSVVATGIMSAHRRLALGAAAPVATNVITIAGAIAFVAVIGNRPDANEVDGTLVVILGWSTTIAVAAMALIQLAGARAIVPGLRFTPRLRHPATRELRSVGVWTALYVVVNQVGLAIVIALASDVTGGVSAYQWAFAVMQLPYAIVAVSLYSSAYPALARIAPDDSTERARQVGRVGEATLLLLAPGAVLLAALAPEIAAVVVGPGDQPLVGATLLGFAASLVPFSVFQLLTRVSYGRGDARTPALVNVAVNAAMLAVDVAVFVTVDRPTQLLAGLAFGHAVSYAVGCVALHALARRGAMDRVGWLHRAWAPAIAGGVMAVAVALAPTVGDESRLGAALTVAIAGGVGAVAYAVAAYGLGVREVAP